MSVKIVKEIQTIMKRQDEILRVEQTALKTDILLTYLYDD